MPIISEGYASTKIQGGTRGKTKVEEKPVQMKANVIEQAQVEEISSTRYVYPPSKFDFFIFCEYFLNMYIFLDPQQQQLLFPLVPPKMW